MNEQTAQVAQWQVWVETGGTFTDCVAVDPGGDLHRAKVLSSSALRGVVERADGTRLRVRARWNAPADFVRGLPFRLLGDAAGEATVTGFAPDPGVSPAGYSLDTGTLTLDTPRQIAAGAAFEIRFPCEAPVLAARLVTRTGPNDPLPPLRLRVATTRGTNALLTRQGDPPAFFVTAGWGDILEIGTQQRPDLFALDIVKPLPLTGAIVEVSERLDASGAVVRAVDVDRVRADAQHLVAQGVRTAAVALMHSAGNPAHETQVAQILREAGFTHLSVSSELSQFVRLLPRAQTAVVNAYLSPIFDRYLGAIHAALAPPATFHVMTSAGGLVEHRQFRGKDSLLSGPAGGVVGAIAAGRAAGYGRIIAFDMGGTSTDVARCDGGPDYVWEHTVGDAHLIAPALAIESVAAGGGSICFASKHGLQVGPQSAGAHPGPACYGAGGPLTLTDINLLLGRLDAARFDIPLDRPAALRAARALVADLDRLTGQPHDLMATLHGLLDIANERMADAIRRISLRRGYDPADYALVAFGGAGSQHAGAVAAKLGIRTVILPPDASLLSAWGLGQAAIERLAGRQILRPLADVDIPALLVALATEAVEAVVAEGVAPDRVAVLRRVVTLRLAGQETGLEIEYGDGSDLAARFANRYAATYGYRPDPARPVEVEAARVVAGAGADALPHPGASAAPDFIEAGWAATAHASGATLLTATGKVNILAAPAAPAPDAVRETLFAGRFSALADEMGEALRRTALSTNVRERLDFSCALLDASGYLVANAAHIPVHLGAMGVCVRAVAARLSLVPGDVAVTNHPAWGGSHLPDVTVITPVFDDPGTTLLGYVASRAHHAEIGGTRPGSMPPDATTLAQEGVVIPPTYLLRGGVSRLAAVCQMLTDAPYPSRAVADNRADLEAALAANRRGADALTRLARDYGAATIAQFMERTQARADTLLRDTLRALPDATYRATQPLDDGTPISVSITLAGETCTIDFAGTGPTLPGNLNAPPAIAWSAVLYVLRLLVREALPLNEGLLRPVRLVLPPGCFINPAFDTGDPARCPAVVGGNTETSQRIVDTLLSALGLAAGSQGTMNNTLYGSDHFGYYETVCGGAGATAHAPGASAVHTHMTNTRITDGEICEMRYPVRIERFAVRRGSGGAGKHPGGDGVIRETVFLAPVALSVLTQHRTGGPDGLAGGEPGQAGRQFLVRASGEVIPLAALDACDARPGDRLVMETPGGGGWG